VLKVSVCFVFWEGKHKNKIVLERQYRGYLVYFTIIFSVKNLKPKGIEKSKNYNKKNGIVTGVELTQK
jgi:hypothetical protein